MGDTGSKDDKFFQRVSLAWLAQDFGSSVDVQVGTLPVTEGLPPFTASWAT